MHEFIHKIIHNFSSLSFIKMVFLAYFIGFIHTLDPSHDKWVIPAIAVGFTDKLKKILLFSISVAIGHTLGMLIFGFVMKGIINFFGISVSTLIGILILFTGLLILFSALKSHKHEHLPNLSDETLSNKQLIFLGLNAGFVPCPLSVIVTSIAVAKFKIIPALVIMLTFSLGIASCIAFFTILFSIFNKKIEFLKQNQKAIKIVAATLIIIWGILIICSTPHHHIH